MPILITLGCGILLAAGSCVGFLNTVNFNGPYKPGNTLFAIGFGLGAVAFLAGCIWAVVAFVLFLLRRGKEEQ